jgi:hypothetical protein
VEHSPVLASDEVLGADFKVTPHTLWSLVRLVGHVCPVFC